MTVISRREAGEAVAARVPRAADNFTVHHAWPADFLIVCSSRRIRDDIMGADVVDGRGFSLRFSPWNRQLQAVRRTFRFRVHLELTGVPSHAWNKTTATAVLGSAAWLERLSASTASREDIGRFQVVAWTDSLELLPREKRLLIEEPDDLMEEDDGLVLPGDALIPLEKTMLQYSIRIRVVRSEDTGEAGSGPGPGPTPDGDEDGSEDDDAHGGRRSGHGSGFVRDGRDQRRRRTDEVPSRRLASPRRRSGDAWGRCRRVAVLSPTEVTPWPEVEDEPEEEDDLTPGGAVPAHVSHVGSPVDGSAAGPAKSSQGGGRAGQREGAAEVWPRPDSTRGKSNCCTVLFGRDAVTVGVASGFDAGYMPVGSPLPGPSGPAAEILAAQEAGAGQEGSVGDSVAGDPTCRSVELESDGDPALGEDCLLSSPGLLPSFAGSVSLDDTWTPPDAGTQCSSPRSVLDFFPVSVLSDGEGATGPKAVETVSTVGSDVDSMRAAYRRPVSTILSRPCRRCKPRRDYTGPVRRSSRLRGRLAAGSQVRQQQRTLITRFGIAREGEVIGDEALEAYLDLFARPLRQEHIDVVLGLFGWQPDALPLVDDAPVECLV